MASDIRFFRLIFNHEELRTFLKENGLVISSEKIHELGLTCRNLNCTNPNKGFKPRNRRRNLVDSTRETLLAEGQNVESIDSLTCKACKTSLSPRTNGFTTYFDDLGRSNCRIAPEKSLQLIYYWTCRRPLIDTIEGLGVTDKTVIDWYNFCRVVCQKANQRAHVRLLGNGQNRAANEETPDVVIQIDECLLRGKRLYNRGRYLTGDNNIPIEDLAEWQQLNDANPDQMNQARNYGRRITGPWIFGMAECHKQTDGSYKTGEVRLIKVERRTADILLPIIRANVLPGSVVWSDEWASYNRIGSDNDNLIHETVNHTYEFVTPKGVHTQNIERVWSSLKLKIVRNMRGTSEELLESHLSEFMFRSRYSNTRWDFFLNFIAEAVREYPITW